MSEEMQKMTEVQKRTFTRWMNHFLSERMLKVDDLFTDLKNGTKLINLLELISSKSLGKYTKESKIKFVQHEMGNLELCLKFIKEEGLRLENIGATDIHRGNGKLILGLIWTLILRYQINLGGDGSSPKQELLDWVNKQTTPYRDHIPEATNFTKSWQDGKILSALTESLKNGIIDTKAAGQDPIRDLDNAMGLADKHFEIPRFVDPEDMAHNPDEHSNMTYIAMFRDYLENRAKIQEMAKQKGPCASKCFAVGRGVSPKGGFAGQNMPFTIHARTINDQPVVGKWDRPMHVTITDANGANVEFDYKDNKDGTFFCKYIAPTPGECKVRIQTDYYPGTPLEDIKGSTYVVPIKEPADCKNSYAEGPGLVRVFDDEPGLFTVYCRDKNNEPVIGEKLKVSVEQVEIAPGGRKVDNVPVAVTDNEDGTFNVKYDAIVPGVYRVNVEVLAGPIRDMPVDVSCFPGADASSTIAQGPGVTQGEPRVGLDAPFEVLVKDKAGAQVSSGGHDVKVTVTGPSGPVDCDVKDNGDGTYSCNYKPNAAGDHTVDVKLNNEDIKDNPFKLNIIKPADPNQSYAEGPGLVQAWDNKANPFKVYAKDEDGVPVAGEPVEVTVTPKDGGPAAPVDVKDNGDGTYDVEYRTDKPGDYDVDVKIRGESIKDMPLTVTCHEGIDPTKSSVEGPGVTGGFAGRVLPFTVITRNARGEQVPVGNGNLGVKVTAPDGSDVPCDLKDNQDGTYSGAYTPTGKGTYKVMVTTEEGQPIGKSPYSAVVRLGADPGQSFARGAGWKKAYDALPTKFTIFAKDAEGNPVHGESVRVVMRKVTSPEEQKKLDEELASMDDYLKQKKLAEIERIEAERKEKQAQAAQEAEEKGSSHRVWTDPEGDVLVTVRDNGDGSYLAEYCAAEAGTYEISVTIAGDDNHIKESPKKVPVSLSKPRIVFWAHTYSKQQEELKRLREELIKAEQLLRDNGIQME